MPRPPEYANWPHDFVWAFLKSTPQGQPGAGPGAVRLFNVEDISRGWDIHILAMDAMARQHMQDRERKPGQPVNMGASGMQIIPYRDLDDEADRLIQRGMQPSTDRNPITVRFEGGGVMEHTPRDWWEQVAAQHIQRRKLEPPVVLTVGQAQVTLKYECFDALCKDFMRRRGDFVSAGWWPELVDPYRDMGQHKVGPKPVEGRANALGQGVQVLQGQGQGGQGGGQIQHPAMENQELV